MDGAGEDFCNDGMIAMLKYSNHFYSHPLRVSKFVKKVACKSCLTSTKPESFVIRTSGSICRAFETIFSEMQIDELDQLPGRKRLSE
jgi:hypothetical protein